MTAHKVTYRISVRGLMHQREVCVAELVDHTGRVVAAGVGPASPIAHARNRLRERVANMHRDQLAALEAP